MSAAGNGRALRAQPVGALLANLVGQKPTREQNRRWSRGDSPRSGEPVWRNSYYVGQIEDRIWRPISFGNARAGKRWTGALLKAARQLEHESRRKRQEVEPGARNGALGDIGLRVLEYLYNVVDYATGRLEPAIRTIAAETGYAYSAVHRALGRLRQHGFLAWMRRSKPVEDPQPGGPQVEQASNAYGLLVPAALKSRLARLFGKAPMPACEEDRRAIEAKEMERMLAGLSATERHAVTWSGDLLLGDTLKRLALAIDRREALEGESSTSDETGGSY